MHSRSRPLLCQTCYGTLELNTPPFCLNCPRQLTSYVTDGLCPSCRKHPPAYDRAWAVCHYNDPMRKLLHQFKYNGKTGLRKTFASLIATFVQTYHVPLGQFDLVIPIPLHAARFRERGFNQSALLAQTLEKDLAIPVSTHNLLRIKNTSPQAQLSKKERWTNIQEAFTIKQPFKLHDKSILLIDDLWTTGATAQEAARSLKHNGAAYVGVLALAIA